MPMGMSRSVRGKDRLVAGAARARGGHGRAQPAVHGLDELGERPDRGDQDRARADEADLVTPGVMRELGSGAVRVPPSAE